MIGGLKRFLQEDWGAELVEWTIVTLILIVATYAILHAVGTEFGVIAASVLEWARALAGL